MAQLPLGPEPAAYRRHVVPILCRPGGLHFALSLVRARVAISVETRSTRHCLPAGEPEGARPGSHNAAGALCASNRTRRPSSPHPSTTAVIGIRGRLSTPQSHIRSPSQPRRPIANAPTEPPSTTRRTSRIGGSPGARQFSPPTTFSKPSATVTRNQPTPGAPCSDR